MASYGLALAAVCVLAFLIDRLSTPFGSVRDKLAAFKVAAYSGPAGWLASVFYLYPPAGALTLLGIIYNLYVIHICAKILININHLRTIGFVSLGIFSYVVRIMLVISMAKLGAALFF